MMNENYIERGKKLNDGLAGCEANSELSDLLNGKWERDERMEALYDRLQLYYDETENCSHRYAAKRWKAFKDWAVGYTYREINRAKRDLAT